MKLVVLLFVASETIFGLVGSAEGVVAYSTLGPGDSYTGNSGYTLGIFAGKDFSAAEAFSPSSTITFDDVDLAAGWISGNNSLIVQLRDDGGGLPGAVLESFTFTNIPEWPQGGSGDLLIGDSLLHPELVAGAQYWVAVLPGATYTSGVWDFSGPPIMNATLCGSTDGGSTWYRLSNTQQPAFRIDGSAVPEPSTFALLGVGAVCLVGYGWRRFAKG